MRVVHIPPLQPGEADSDDREAPSVRDARTAPRQSTGETSAASATSQKQPVVASTRVLPSRRTVPERERKQADVKNELRALAAGGAGAGDSEASAQAAALQLARMEAQERELAQSSALEIDARGQLVPRGHGWGWESPALAAAPSARGVRPAATKASASAAAGSAAGRKRRPKAASSAAAASAAAVSASARDGTVETEGWMMREPGEGGPQLEGARWGEFELEAAARSSSHDQAPSAPALAASSAPAVATSRTPHEVAATGTGAALPAPVWYRHGVAHAHKPASPAIAAQSSSSFVHIIGLVELPGAQRCDVSPQADAGARAGDAAPSSSSKTAGTKRGREAAARDCSDDVEGGAPTRGTGHSGSESSRPRALVTTSATGEQRHEPRLAAEAAATSKRPRKASAKAASMEEVRGMLQAQSLASLQLKHQRAARVLAEVQHQLQGGAWSRGMVAARPRSRPRKTYPSAGTQGDAEEEGAGDGQGEGGEDDREAGELMAAALGDGIRSWDPACGDIGRPVAGFGASLLQGDSPELQEAAPSLSSSSGAAASKPRGLDESFEGRLASSSLPPAPSIAPSPSSSLLQTGARAAPRGNSFPGGATAAGLAAMYVTPPPYMAMGTGFGPMQFEAGAASAAAYYEGTSAMLMIMGALPGGMESASSSMFTPPSPQTAYLARGRNAAAGGHQAAAAAAASAAAGSSSAASWGSGYSGAGGASQGHTQQLFSGGTPPMFMSPHIGAPAGGGGLSAGFMSPTAGMGSPAPAELAAPAAMRYRAMPIGARCDADMAASCAGMTSPGLSGGSAAACTSRTAAHAAYAEASAYGDATAPDLMSMAALGSPAGAGAGAGAGAPSPNFPLTSRSSAAALACAIGFGRAPPSPAGNLLRMLGPVLDDTSA